MKLLGVNVNLCNILLCVLLIIIINVFITYSCVENFTTNTPQSLSAAGADLNYSMGKGLKVSWENNYVENNLNTNVGGEVPLPEGELYMFYKNKFDENCCPSAYSSSNGCACISKEQADYLNKRGGNRTLTSEY